MQTCEFEPSSALLHFSLSYTKSLYRDDCSCIYIIHVFEQNAFKNSQILIKARTSHILILVNLTHHNSPSDKAKLLYI